MTPQQQAEQSQLTLATLDPMTRAGVIQQLGRAGITVRDNEPLRVLHNVGVLENIKRAAVTAPVDYRIHYKMDQPGIMLGWDVTVRGVSLNSFSGAVPLPDTTYGLDRVNMLDYFEFQWTRSNRSLTIGEDGGYVPGSQFARLVNHDKLGTSEVIPLGENQTVLVRLGKAVAGLEKLWVTMRMLALPV